MARSTAEQSACRWTAQDWWLLDDERLILMHFDQTADRWQDTHHRTRHRRPVPHMAGPGSP